MTTNRTSKAMYKLSTRDMTMCGIAFKYNLMEKCLMKIADKTRKYKEDPFTPDNELATGALSFDPLDEQKLK